jgi:hypothetical protein
MIVDYTDLDSMVFVSGGETTVTCKFVSLLVESTPHLIVGPVDDFPYHANLIDRFCNERNIASAWEHKPDLVEVYDTNVEIHGGGWMRIDPVHKSIKVYGRSTAYGTYDRDVVTEVISNHPEYSEFSLQLPAE